MRPQPGPVLKPSVGSRLLAQGDVLESEPATCDQAGAKQPDQQGEEKAHGRAILLQLETTTISPRMGFRRSTALVSEIVMTTTTQDLSFGPEQGEAE